MPGRTGLLRATDSDLLIGFAAIIAGLLAVTGPAAPTGDRVTDAVLVGIGVALIVMIGARAPWWAVGAAAGVALAVAVDPLLMGVAGIGLAAALWTGTSQRPLRWVLAASLGVTFNVLARSELGGRTGVSAAVGMGVAVAVFVLGTWRFSGRMRLLAWAGAILVVVAAGAAVAGFGYAAAKARDDLASGMGTAELGVTALESGDFEAAADLFAEARGYLDAANSDLDEPWAQFAAYIPLAGYYQRAVADMSQEGATALAVVSEALDEIDLDALRPQEGRFDLEALAELDAPLTRVRDALVGLKASSEDARSVWLVNRATYALDDFSESVDAHLPSIDDALAAIRLAPEMLGADGPRTYLLLFTTPSESRALGGFVGSYAELRVADGQLTLGEFDRSQDIDRTMPAVRARVRDHEEFLAQNGRFGYDADGTGGGLVGDAGLRNLAMTPDFPTVAEIAADLYAQTTGTQIDGVVAMDPFVVTQLLRYTGPVLIPSLGRELSADEALSYLLREQYTVDVPDEERADELAVAASQAFDGLLAGALPDPIQIARDLGPLTGDRRLLVWSAHAEEQAMIDTVGISGEIPPPGAGDGWAFTVSNVGGNKIDTFLDRRAVYTASTDARTGVTTGTLRIELDNRAPATGFPKYVIGNRVGQPEGTNSLWLSIYSPLGLDGLTIDGAAAGVETGTERGWNVYRLRVDIASMATAVVEATVSGTLADPDADLVTWEQPMERDVQPL